MPVELPFAPMFLGVTGELDKFLLPGKLVDAIVAVSDPDAHLRPLGAHGCFEPSRRIEHLEDVRPKCSDEGCFQRSWDFACVGRDECSGEPGIGGIESAVVGDDHGFVRGSGEDAALIRKVDSRFCGPHEGGVSDLSGWFVLGGDDGLGRNRCRRSIGCAACK